MRKNAFLFILAAMALCACHQTGPIESSFENAGPSSSSALATSNELPSSISSEGLLSSSSYSEASSLPLSSNSLSASSSSSATSSKPASSSRISSSQANEDGETLPCGNKKLPAPDNSSSPIDVSDWVNFDMSENLPDHWSHIYGNNTTNPSFYAPSYGGGIKMDQAYKGLQSPFINSWNKIEVRLTISSVSNNSKKPDKGKPTMFVYGYDQGSNLIEQGEISEGSITANTREVKFYIRNSEVAYFEVRLNAFPYKNSQCYNFGIGGVSIKGWPYA